MEIAAVFVLSLVGGWAFALRWRLTRYSMLRAEGQHTYFRAAFFGVALYVITLLLRVVLKVYVPQYDDFDDALAGYARQLLKPPRNSIQEDVVVTAALSVLVGPLLAGAINRFTPKHWALRKAISPQDALLFDAQRQEMPVSLTLLTGRVYVGIVMAIPDPERPPPVVTLLPMYSGYRDGTGRLILTTDYELVYEALKNKSVSEQVGLPSNWRRSFELAIRADQVVTATMFVPKVYAHFNPHWRATLQAQSPSPPPLEVRAEIVRATR